MNKQELDTRVDSLRLLADARATAAQAVADSNAHLWRCDSVGGGNVCFRGTGVIVTFVAERFAAGERLAYLAQDYGLPLDAIEAGIRAVVGGASGRFGIRRDVERRMEAEIQSEPHPSEIELAPASAAVARSVASQVEPSTRAVESAPYLSPQVPQEPSHHDIQHSPLGQAALRLVSHVGALQMKHGACPLCGNASRGCHTDCVTKPILEALTAKGPQEPSWQPLRALIAKWREEAAHKDSFHATMGIGWKACANELEALLPSPPTPGQEPADRERT